jgi:hypothetical protein
MAKFSWLSADKKFAAFLLESAIIFGVPRGPVSEAPLGDPFFDAPSLRDLISHGKTAPVAGLHSHRVLERVI